MYKFILIFFFSSFILIIKSLFISDDSPEKDVNDYEEILKENKS